MQLSFTFFTHKPQAPLFQGHSNSFFLNYYLSVICHWYFDTGKIENRSDHGSVLTQGYGAWVQSVDK